MTQKVTHRSESSNSIAPPRKRKAPLRWIFASIPLVAVTIYASTYYAHDAVAQKGSALPIIDAPRIEGSRTVFSERYAKRIGLQTVEVKDATLVPTVSVVGTVTFNPQYVAHVGTRLRGLVRDVYRFEGSTVKQGELLAQIDSPELGEAQAAITSLKAQVIAAERNATREQVLAEKRLTTHKESEDAIATQGTYSAMLAAAQQKVTVLAGRYTEGSVRTLGLHQIVSPLDGTIVERNISRGQLVDGEHNGFLVANLDHLWVELAVFERSLSAIRKGDRVELRPLSDNSTTIFGDVAQIGDRLNEGTRSASVRVKVDNRERRLRPGQAIDATIHTSGTTVDSGIVISPSAVTFVDGKPTVFVADTPTSVIPTNVVLGASGSQGLQIVEGLRPGQRVVIAGAFELKSELFR